MPSQKHETLAERVCTLRARIEQVRKRKDSIGESNTKAVLVGPLLSALGWDLEDLDEVRLEYKRKPQDNPVDYALFLLRTPRLFVEAKALDTDLGDRKWISQTLGYATVVGVEWCVLTDGNEYRIYNAHAPVDVEEKLFRAVRVTSGTEEEHALETLGLLSKDKLGENLLETLWKSHFVDRRVGAALDEIMSEDNAGLVRLIRRRQPDLSPSEIRESLGRADVRVEFPVVPVPDKKPTPTTRKPRPAVSQRTRLVDLLETGLATAPLELQRVYKGTLLKATVLPDGKVSFAGTAYNSLSTAAGEARRSVSGDVFARRRPQTNGWTFWQYRDPDSGRLQEIDLLRRKLTERA